MDILNLFSEHDWAQLVNCRESEKTGKYQNLEPDLPTGMGQAPKGQEQVHYTPRVFNAAIRRQWHRQQLG